VTPFLTICQDFFVELKGTGRPRLEHSCTWAVRRRKWGAGRPSPARDRMKPARKFSHAGLFVAPLLKITALMFSESGRLEEPRLNLLLAPAMGVSADGGGTIAPVRSRVGFRWWPRCRTHPAVHQPRSRVLREFDRVGNQPRLTCSEVVMSPRRGALGFFPLPTAALARTSDLPGDHPTSEP
jgi:hypothetical protein